MLGILAKEKYLNLRLGKEIPLQKIGTLESEDVSVIPFLITSLGEIYGFADNKGDLYFDDVNQYPFLYKDTRARIAKRFEKFFACFAKKFSDFLFAAGGCKDFFRGENSGRSEIPY